MNNSHYFHCTFIRHGETNENRSRIMQGQMDTSLSDIGFKQAEETGEFLKFTKLDLIFCSDLIRTTQTANEIMAKNIPMQKSEVNDVVMSELLRERSFGIYSGYSQDEWRKTIDPKQRLSKTWIPDEGESIIQVQERAIKSFKMLCKLMRKRMKTINNGDHIFTCNGCPLYLTNNECNDTVKCFEPESKQQYLGHAVLISHGGLLFNLIQYLSSINLSSSSKSSLSSSASKPSSSSDNIDAISDLTCHLSNCGLTQLTISFNGNRSNSTPCIKWHSINYIKHLSIMPLQPTLNTQQQQQQKDASLSNNNKS